MTAPYPKMALTSQKMALKKAKAIVAFHCAHVAVPSNAMPSQLNTYLIACSQHLSLPLLTSYLTYPQLPSR